MYCTSRPVGEGVYRRLPSPALEVDDNLEYNSWFIIMLEEWTKYCAGKKSFFCDHKNFYTMVNTTNQWRNLKKNGEIFPYFTSLTLGIPNLWYLKTFHFVGWIHVNDSKFRPLQRKVKQILYLPSPTFTLQEEELTHQDTKGCN